MQIATHAVVISGYAGILNLRGTSGCVRLKMNTPIATNTKANSVPMLVNSAATSIFIVAANNATRPPTMTVPHAGVLNLVCTLWKMLPIRPSRLIE